MDHGRDRSWEERENRAAWPEQCYKNWSMCTDPGGVNGLQLQPPCSFCPLLPSFRKFAPGHINAENRDVQMLPLAATSSCHSDGSCAHSTTHPQTFLLYAYPASRGKGGNWTVKPWLLDVLAASGLTIQCFTLDLLLNPTHLFGNSSIGRAL